VITVTKTGCGKCTATIANGKPCGNTIVGQCEQGSACEVTSATTASGTCQTITFGGIGSKCTDQAKQCSDGSYCDLLTGKCVATIGQGGACTSIYACTFPYVCTGKSGQAQKCQSPGGAGAACQGDDQCASDLGCSTKSQTCGAVSWASAGEACGDLTRCLVGSCPAMITQGTKTVCPKVLADGAACGTSTANETCDVEAECLGNKCVLAGLVQCK
jgi:hypothetical protein